jgi:O-methyltransferase
MNFNFFSTPVDLPKHIRFVNKLLKRLNLHYEVVATPRFNKELITTEQNINLYHLLSQVLFFKVPGEIVELGAHVGQSAIIIQSVIESMHDVRTLIVFDKFDFIINGRTDKEIFIDTFKKSALRMPEMHQGRVEETLPDELPEEIAFIHIDLGLGPGNSTFYSVITHCLESVYPRMSPGAVCLLMDYHDPAITVRGNDENPGLKKACDEFFKDKEEKVFVLYGNQYSHGYFRKNISERKSYEVEKIIRKRLLEFEKHKS